MEIEREIEKYQKQIRALAGPPEKGGGEISRQELHLRNMAFLKSVDPLDQTACLATQRPLLGNTSPGSSALCLAMVNGSLLYHPDSLSSNRSGLWKLHGLMRIQYPRDLFSSPSHSQNMSAKPYQTWCRHPFPLQWAPSRDCHNQGARHALHAELLTKD